jgi:Domain of unknown function (DUF4129)
VGIAAHGRPLGRSGGGSGAGLPATFWDFAFTTVLIVEVLLGIAAIYLLFLFRREPKERKPFQSRTIRALVMLFAVIGLVVLIGHRVDLQHLLHPNSSTTPTVNAPGAGVGTGGRASPRHVQFRWEELVVVLAVLLALGALAADTRRRLGRPAGARSAPDVLAAALDESLDDLRGDPDLRRAIVAAYARMETALAAAGLPRRPAEAPLEYVERALLSLDTSAAAVRRLTDLFEWARFSQHEPEPSMRDDAVDALIAVRDELRAAELTPA